jgi:hypothetical protein
MRSGDYFSYCPLPKTPPLLSAIEVIHPLSLRWLIQRSIPPSASRVHLFMLIFLHWMHNTLFTIAAAYFSSAARPLKKGMRNLQP